MPKVTEKTLFDLFYKTSLNKDLQDKLAEHFRPLGIVAYSNCCRPGCSGTYEQDDDFKDRKLGIYMFRLHLNGMNYSQEVDRISIHWGEKIKWLEEHWEQETQLIDEWCQIVCPGTTYQIEKPTSKKRAIMLNFDTPLILEEKPEESDETTEDETTNEDTEEDETKEVIQESYETTDEESKDYVLDLEQDVIQKSDETTNETTDEEDSDTEDETEDSDTDNYTPSVLSEVDWLIWEDPGTVHMFVDDETPVPYDSVPSDKVPTCTEFHNGATILVPVHRWESTWAELILPPGNYSLMDIIQHIYNFYDEPLTIVRYTDEFKLNPEKPTSDYEKRVLKQLSKGNPQKVFNLMGSALIGPGIPGFVKAGERRCAFWCNGRVRFEGLKKTKDGKWKLLLGS